MVVVGDTSDNDLPNGPKHLQHLSRWSSQSHWHNFGAVGRCVGDEDTPWNTFEDLGSKEHSLTGTEVEDEDKEVQAHETANGCPSISDRTGDWTGDEDTDKGTDRSAALKC